MKRKHWYIGVFVLLAIILAILVFLRQRESAGQAGPVVVYNTREISLGDLQLPSAVTVTSRDGKQYTGQPMAVILGACDIPGEALSKLTFATKDGMSLSIGASEINSLYLSTDDTGDWRLIIPGDEFKQRWVRQISKITLE